MAKFTVFLLILLSFTASAEDSRQQDEAVMRNSLSNLIHVEGDFIMVVTPSEHDGFKEVELDMVITEELKDILVTVEQAKEMKLEKTKSYFLTTQTGFDALYQQALKKIKTDDPKFFSIQYYEHALDGAEKTEFSAHIIEYK